MTSFEWSFDRGSEADCVGGMVSISGHNVYFLSFWSVGEDNVSFGGAIYSPGVISVATPWIHFCTYRVWLRLDASRFYSRKKHGTLVRSGNKSAAVFVAASLALSVNITFVW